MTTVTTLVTENEDDGFRWYDSGMGDWDFNNGANYVRVGSEDDGMGGANDMTPYFRFLEVDVPRDANITSAKLQYKLYASYDNSSSRTTKIYGQKPGGGDCDSTDITDGEALQSALEELTDGTGVDGSGYTTWTPATSTDTTNYQDSADFTDVIQELVNRSCWKETEEDYSAITIFLTDNTAATPMGPYYMAIKSIESGHPVKLVIDYTEASSAVSNPAFLLFMD